MRVTNRLIQSSSIARLQTGLQAVDRARDDISTGLRLRFMSDDPTSGSEVVRVGSSLRALEQFRRNIRTGEARAQAEEGVLDRLTDTLGRAIELGLGQASSTATAQTRLVVKAEVDQLLGFAVNLGNTKLGEDFLFGGTRGNERPLRLPALVTDPFTNLVDAAANPVNPSGSIPIEIADGRYVTPNHNATEIFLDTNTLQSLRDLSTALGANDVPGINAAVASLQGASNEIQTLIGAQGARASEYNTASKAIDSLESTMIKFRSDLRDTEIEKAMVELVGRQTGYQAAMAATTRVLGLSLANYL